MDSLIAQLIIVLWLDERTFYLFFPQILFLVEADDMNHFLTLKGEENGL